MRVAFFLCSLPEDDLENRQYPLGTGYLGALLQRERGAEVLITADVDKILAWNPDLVGISSVSQCYEQAKSVCFKVRKFTGAGVMLGGYHISALPTSLSPFAHVGVLGEGEVPLLKLYDLWQEHRAFRPEDLASINGLCFHGTDGKIVVNALRDEVKDLDSLPHPMRDTPEGYRPMWMFSARGCVYKCQFCASSRHWNHYRPHSPDYVVDEIEDLIVNRKATFIEFLDDLFFANAKRVEKIAEEMERRGLTGKATFHGFITSNLAKREVLETAKAMGFTSIRFGAETGSDRLLKQMKGNWASLESHQRCVDLSKELGLNVMAAFMFGTPGETEEDIAATKVFLERNKGVLSISGFYLTTPVPGTPYWDMAMDMGLVAEDMDWRRVNIDFSKVLSFDFDRAIYMNEANIPRPRFKELVTEIATRYLRPEAAEAVRHNLPKGTMA